MNTTGVKVYLRNNNNHDDAVGKQLCEVPLSMLTDESVIDLIGGWGVDLAGVGVVGREWLTGQFVLDDRGAIFEVVLAGPEEPADD